MKHYMMGDPPPQPSWVQGVCSIFYDKAAKYYKVRINTHYIVHYSNLSTLKRSNWEYSIMTIIKLCMSL